MLRDKIMEAARAEIEEGESETATVVEWRLVEVRHGKHLHQLIASVNVTTATLQEGCSFEVWVLADLDTEEVTCL